MSPTSVTWLVFDDFLVNTAHNFWVSYSWFLAGVCQLIRQSKYSFGVVLENNCDGLYISHKAATDTLKVKVPTSLRKIYCQYF